MSWFKALVGVKLAARGFENQKVETLTKGGVPNRMVALGRPVSRRILQDRSAPNEVTARAGACPPTYAKTPQQRPTAGLPDVDFFTFKSIFSQIAHAPQTGAAMAESIKRFKVAYGIFGIGTIDDDSEPLDYAYRDLSVSRTVMDNSRKRFLVMEHSTFSGDAMMRLGHVSEVDALFASGRPPAAICRTLRANGVKLHVARV